MQAFIELWEEFKTYLFINATKYFPLQFKYCKIISDGQESDENG